MFGTFFDCLRDYSMDVKIGKLLERYADFSFRILNDRRAPAVPPDTKEQVLRPAVLFFRDRDKDNNPIPIKVARGEETLFIWCFFLAIAELAMTKEKPVATPGGSAPASTTSYDWVKYLYIDDPISSLARTQDDELLTTLQKGFKYIEEDSFQSTFQGLFSEINLASDNDS